MSKHNKTKLYIISGRDCTKCHYFGKECPENRLAECLKDNVIFTLTKPEPKFYFIGSEEAKTE